MDGAAARRDEGMDEVVRALADGTRRGLLRLVRDGERPAGELAAAFPEMSRPAVSQHLRVLHRAGLVTIRPDGTRRLYRARSEGLTEVRQFIEELWTDRLARLKQAAEQAQRRATETTKDERPERSSP